MTATARVSDFRAWRHRLGLSQRTAAQSLRVSLGTVRAWEQGRNPIPAIVALAMAWVETSAKKEQSCTD